MTVEERLARLEERVAGQNEWMKSIADDVKQLRTVADTGKGALGLFLKVGGIILGIVGGLATAVAYLIERLHK